MGRRAPLGLALVAPDSRPRHVRVLVEARRERERVDQVAVGGIERVRGESEAPRTPAQAEVVGDALFRLEIGIALDESDRRGSEEEEILRVRLAESVRDVGRGVEIPHWIPDQSDRAAERVVVHAQWRRRRESGQRREEVGAIAVVGVAGARVKRPPRMQIPLRLAVGAVVVEIAVGNRCGGQPARAVDRDARGILVRAESHVVAVGHVACAVLADVSWLWNPTVVRWR